MQSDMYSDTNNSKIMYMKKYTLLFISLFLSIVASAANKREIYVEVAGTLSSMISDEEKYTIEELTLTGKLNGLDFPGRLVYCLINRSRSLYSYAKNILEDI